MRALIFVLSVLLPATIGDQRRTPEPTLLELAREQGGIHRMTMGCGPAVRLEDIVSKAQLIVYGTVVAVESRLSGDGRHVLTDHRVQPFIVLYDGLTRERVDQEARVFTAQGGSLVIEGFSVSESVEHNSRKVALNVGDEVVVMGSVEKQMLMLGPVGVFIVSDGAVKANGTVEGFKDKGPGVPLDQFITRVLTLSAHN
jgi:hypothetical protein